MSKFSSKYENIFYFISLFIVHFVAIYILYMDHTRYIGRLLIDDALYYPIVSRNIAIGNGSTFDGLTITNGYHPLWCFINIPFMFLSDENITRLMIFKALVTITVLLMIWVWDNTLKFLGFPKISRAVFLLFMGGMYFWSIKVYYSGLEIPLVTMFIGLSIILLKKALESNNPKFFILFGAVSALMFLSRLDSIFVLFSFVLYLLWKKISFKNIVYFSIPFLIFVFPYLTYNYLVFNNIVPVSGRKKTIESILPAIQYNFNKFIEFINHEIWRISKVINIYIFFLIIFIIVVIFLYNFIIKFDTIKPIIKKYNLFLIILFGTAFHLLYNILFMSEITVNWYQYLVYLTLFISFGILFELINEKFRIIIASVFILLCLYQLNIVQKKDSLPIAIKTIEAAHFAKYNFDKDKIFLMHDPGVFAFISEKKTIAGNGLIGNNRTLELLKERNYKTLVDEFKIDYVAEIFYPKKLRGIELNFLYKTKEFLYGRDTAFVGILSSKEFLRLFDQ